MHKSQFLHRCPILLPAQECCLTLSDCAGKPNFANFIPVLFLLHTFFARKICLEMQMDLLRSCGKAVVTQSLQNLRIEQSPDTSEIGSDCLGLIHLQHSFHSINRCFLRNFWMFKRHQHRPSSCYFPLSCQAYRPSN